MSDVSDDFGFHDPTSLVPEGARTIEVDEDGHELDSKHRYPSFRSTNSLLLIDRSISEYKHSYLIFYPLFQCYVFY